MFRCDFCGHITAPRTNAFRIILETRPKSYPFRSQANPFRRRLPGGKIDDKPRDDSGGNGTEIVREAIVCPACALQDRS
jgi:hypothetical protein